MGPRSESFKNGAMALSPVIVGVIPFAMIYGIAATQAGFSLDATVLISLIVFAGAAQLAMVQLFTEHAPVLIIIFATLIINLRFVMYSASLAPYLAGVRAWQKIPLSYILTDQAYAVTVARFNGGGSKDKKPWFYLGGSALLWVTWQAGTLAGALLGAAVPSSWALDFAVPLTFMSLIAPVVTDRPQLAAVIAAGVVSILASGLPYNLGLLLGAVCGITAGGLTGRGR